MFMKSTTQSHRRRWVVGLIIGLAASLSLITMNAVSSTPQAGSVSADQGVDQMNNGDGTCTTTVAGWVSIPNDKCKPRMPAPVRQCAFNVAGSAMLGLVFGGAAVASAVKGGAAGALVGCAGSTA